MLYPLLLNVIRQASRVVSSSGLFLSCLIFFFFLYILMLFIYLFFWLVCVAPSVSLADQSSSYPPTHPPIYPPTHLPSTYQSKNRTSFFFSYSSSFSTHFGISSLIYASHSLCTLTSPYPAHLFLAPTLPTLLLRSLSSFVFYPS